MSEINLDSPRWPQDTYMGRAKHFLTLTNPLNMFASSSKLDEAQRVVLEYRKTKKMPAGYDEDKLWAAKYLYDSAHHPDTGERQLVVGRMAAQAPMNTLITGSMICFYKTTTATVFWQWVNQTFNAVVNYTNRSGDKPISKERLLASYAGACGGALSIALFLNSRVKNLNPVFARLVPFVAVGGANCINIPMMRSSELENGVPVFTAAGEQLGESRRAAKEGITLVTLSRILMATPGMILVPLATNHATKKNWFARYPWAPVPFQMVGIAICLSVATPLCCAIFEQQARIKVVDLEPELKEIAQKKNLDVVYYNKGL